MGVFSSDFLRAPSFRILHIIKDVTKLKQNSQIECLKVQEECRHILDFWFILQTSFKMRIHHVQNSAWSKDAPLCMTFVFQFILYPLSIPFQLISSCQYLNTVTAVLKTHNYCQGWQLPFLEQAAYRIFLAIDIINRRQRTISWHDCKVFTTGLASRTCFVALC